MAECVVDAFLVVWAIAHVLAFFLLVSATLAGVPGAFARANAVYYTHPAANANLANPLYVAFVYALQVCLVVV